MTDKPTGLGLIGLAGLAPPLPPPPTPSLQALIQAMAKDVHDRYYKSETIYLDGYKFTNCCFHNCTLITDTGLFTIRSCTFANTVVNYGPNALKIVQLYSLYQKSQWPVFNPVVAADGSVTIE